jgi:hypothetical protein
MGKKNSLKRTISLVSYSSIDENHELCGEDENKDDSHDEPEHGPAEQDTESIMQLLIRLPRAMGSKRKREVPQMAVYQVGDLFYKTNSHCPLVESVLVQLSY